jgi:nucleotide-binding universal stress UspA family protein
MKLARILVAMDFSETSEAALEYAIDLATTLPSKPKITIAHLYELPVYTFPSGAMVATVDVATQIMTGATEAADAMCRKHANAGVELTPIVREGAAWEEVHKIADEIDADLVVIGTHGRRGISHALLGSVAEKIIRTATRPILTIHHRHK